MERDDYCFTGLYAWTFAIVGALAILSTGLVMKQKKGGKWI